MEIITFIAHTDEISVTGGQGSLTARTVYGMLRGEPVSTCDTFLYSTFLVHLELIRHCAV